MATLKNINFMSQSRFNALGSLSQDELYAVEADIVGGGMPDYSAGVSKGWSSFTADKNGWIYCYSQVNSNQSYVYINNVEVHSTMNNNYADGGGSFAPISKNDIVTVGGSTYSKAYIIFYPCKGE